jgi:5-methylthioribose kinase
LGIREAAAGRERRLQEIRRLWQSFAEGFQALAAEKTRDIALAEPDYARQFLRQVWTDALGFCGTELIRRTIGLAHVADLDQVADADMRHECQRNALNLGRMLILAAAHIEDDAALIARVRQTC